MEITNTAKWAITYEMMEKVFGVPNGVQITRVEDNWERGIVEFVFQSEEPVENYTRSKAEGQEISQIAVDEEIFIRGMKEMVYDWERRTGTNGDNLKHLEVMEDA